MENRQPFMLAGFAQHRARLLISSGALLLSAAASFVIAAPAAAAPGYALVAFLHAATGIAGDANHRDPAELRSLTKSIITIW